mmetsp:Transcript_47125/g.115043  ORF Transcript_47125/g.115043 Transcript_47125/m.115043 type:complete len:301 (+) Transcript_47125:2667-3569(+)
MHTNKHKTTSKQNNRNTTTIPTCKKNMNTQDPEDEGGGERDRDGSFTSMSEEEEEETMIPPAPPSTPLASFMSSILHTENFSDLKLVSDGSPAHRSKRGVYSHNRRRIDHGYRRRLTADMSLDHTCHCCRDFSASSTANRRDLSTGVPSIGSPTTCTYCQGDGIGMPPDADHEEESPTLRALSRGMEICDDYEKDLAPTVHDSCDDSAHVIDRWKNGADSPMTKKRPHFQPARRLPSFDRTPLPVSSPTSTSQLPPSPPPTPPRPLTIHRRGSRRPVAFPKEKWHQEIPTLNIIGMEDGS